MGWKTRGTIRGRGTSTGGVPNRRYTNLDPSLQNISSGAEELNYKPNKEISMQLPTKGRRVQCGLKGVPRGLGGK